MSFPSCENLPNFTHVEISSFDRSDNQHPIPVRMSVERAAKLTADLVIRWQRSKPGRKVIGDGSEVRFLFSSGKLASVLNIDPVICEGATAK